MGIKGFILNILPEFCGVLGSVTLFWEDFMTYCERLHRIKLSGLSPRKVDERMLLGMVAESKGHFSPFEL